MECHKRRYESVRVAKRATQNVSNKFRVYFCRSCKAYHVTNDETSRKGEILGEKWTER